jgi:hypothetical protein
MVLMHRLRTGLAVVGLSGVYWGVVTPLAWWLKVMGRTPLALSPEPTRSTYWLPIEVDSTAKDVYREGSGLDGGGRWDGGWWRLIRAYRTMGRGRSSSLQWVVLLALLPWVPCVSHRDDPRVRSDLYVLF